MIENWILFAILVSEQSRKTKIKIKLLENVFTTSFLEKLFYFLGVIWKCS